MQLRTVLIVADAPADRLAYRHFLAADPGYRYTIVEATQGVQAIALCQQVKPDCILLDPRLPDCDGMTLLATLVDTLRPDGAAIIMLTDSNDADVAVQALHNGAYDYLHKERITATRLQQTINNTIDKVALQRELVRQREWFRVTLSSIGDGVITTDMTGAITFMNGVAEALTGWPTAAALGQALTAVFQIINEHTREPVINPVEKVLQGGAVVGLANHTLLIRRDGSELPIDDSAAPIKNSQGQLLGVVLTFRDNSEQRRAAAALQANEARFRAIADYTYDWESWIGPDGRPLWINPAVERLTGWSVDECLHMPDYPLALIHPLDRARMGAYFQAALIGSSANDVTFRVQQRDGHVRWVAGSWQPIKHEAGVQGYRTSVRDISERLQAEEQLRYQASLLANVQDAVISTDTNFRIVTWNQGAEQLYGWAASAAIGKPVGEILHTKYLDTDPATVINHFQTHGRWQGEVLQRNQKGETRVISNVTVLLRDGDGRAKGAIAINRDITERKHAEQALRASEAHLRNIIDNLAAFVGIMRPDGTLIEANRTALQAANLTPAAVLGKHFAETYWWAYSPQVQADLRAAIERAAAGEVVRYDVTVRLGEEHYIIVDFMLAPILDENGQVTYLVPSGVDVSERRRAEAALRNSEAHFRSLFASMTQGVVYQDGQGQIMDANSAAERILGLSLAQMQGRISTDPRWRATRADGSPFPGAEHPAMVALRTGQVVEGVVMGVFHPDRNEQRWLLVDAVPQFRDGEVRPYQVYALFNDFTERRHAEEALRASEEQLRLALSGGGMGIWEWQAESGQSNWSEQEYALFALPVGTEITYELFDSLLHPADRAQFQQLINTVMTKGGDYSHEFRIIRPDGEVRWLAERGIGILNEQGQPSRVLGINFDITERKTQEEALHQLNLELEARVTERTNALEVANEKLAITNQELEQFTYAAAHDLKTPLRGIQNLAQWLIEDAAPLLPAASQKHLTQLQNRVQRLERLLDGLLAYSRIGRERYVVESVDTRVLVEEISDLLAPPAGFTLTADATLPTLVTHRVPLETVLRNLINNAIKHHHQPATGHVQVRAHDQGNHVEFWVQDDGPGINPEFHERIFEMFQTLQPRDRVEGSGIGLAIVKKIVIQQGGTISLRSSIGAGATFIFTWPPIMAPTRQIV